MLTRRGALIEVEGPDGVGKSTAAGLFIEKLRARGVHVLRVREPGGTDIGERIRAITKSDALVADGYVDLFLYSAARRQLLQEVVGPAVEAGRVVVSDRSVMSTYAYQGAGQGIPDDVIAQVSALAIGDVTPDIRLVLDLDDATWEERIEGRGTDRDRYEQHAILTAVRDRYRSLTDEWDSAVSVSAAGPPAEVAARLVSCVRPLLESRGLWARSPEGKVRR